MRRWQGVLLFAGLTGLTTPAQPGGKPPTYWANHKVDIPVNVDAVKRYHADQKLPDPSDLQLYVARNGGDFVPARKLPFNKLDATGEGKSGFWFTADKDGSYEFSVQFLYADKPPNPATDRLSPQQRIAIDTTPPAVQVRGVGNRVDWTVTDDNLDPASVKLQAKLAGAAQWETITARPMRPTDRYAWQLGPTDAMEVRVLARDKAGNEGYSQLVRLPADGGGGVNPRPAPPGGAGGDWPPAAPPARQPKIVYVNTMKFDVDYTIERMGPSGVKTAHLWVQKGQGQGDWSLAESKAVDLPAGGGAQKLSLPYLADTEGVYGFVVIPESGAGVKAASPRKDDPPQVMVVVDVAKPKVSITDIAVRRGGVNGAVVDITWEAGDGNLMPNSINLEYSEDSKVWKEIKYKLANQGGAASGTGRYEWSIPDATLWRFHVRIRATDLAGNVGEFDWGKLVMVDLETPSAVIGGVRGSGTPVQTDPSKKSDPPKKDTPAGGNPTPKGGPPAVPALPMTGGVSPPGPGS